MTVAEAIPKVFSMTTGKSLQLSYVIYEMKGGSRLIVNTKILWFFPTRYCLLCEGNKKL